jgi:hypothetical protein
MSTSAIIGLILIAFFILAGIIVWVRLRKVDDLTVVFTSAGLISGVGAVFSIGALFALNYINASDYTTYNGEITEKVRTHGTYEEPYECMCTTITSGSGSNQTSYKVCQTCYETHYTVKWTACSNIGDFTIDSLDSTWRSVYSSPDPAFYQNIKLGDPVSRLVPYRNYIKLAPDTLFRAPPGLEGKWNLPEYPNQIYNYYSVDRVVNIGLRINNLKEWNSKLSEALKKLGPSKHANVVIVLTSVSDPNLAEALKAKWLGGKDNDTVIVMGVERFDEAPAWVRVFSASKSDVYNVRLRDALQDLTSITPDTVIDTISAGVQSGFSRKSLEDLKYLEDEYHASWGSLIMIIISGIIGTLLGIFFVYKMEN